jgi:glycosyltransferase involved in cell wall biosynthesis
MVHYTPPGIVGGVESVMAEHTRLLRQRGFCVSHVAGRRGRFPNVSVIPELDVARPGAARIEKQLAEGAVSTDFERARESILTALQPLAGEADVIIAHNAFTLHFSLPLTAALWRIAKHRQRGSTIAWCHDLSWTNPLYIPAMHDGYPWDLLRCPAPGTQYVTVSHVRKRELAGLWQSRHDDITVVPNGMDPAEVMRLSPPARAICQRFGLFDRDAVLLLPVRITRRKNIEKGMEIVRALKDRSLNLRFLVSGPIAQHHPGRARAYLAELKALRAALELEEEVVFLAEAVGRRLSDRTVRDLYSVCDALLFPSAQEGFGLPILEAGLTRAPAVLADIPIFEEIGGRDAVYFDLRAPAEEIAPSILDALNSGPARLFRRVLRDYRWDVIADRYLVPLVAAAESDWRKG